MQQSLFGSMVSEEPVALAPAEPLSLDETLFTVIDLETTGLNPKKSAITEITAIRYRDGIEVDKYSTLVKPTEEIPPEVENLTGITNEMVQSAPAPVIALSELAAFVGPNPIVVGHNVSFDINFLREKLEVNGLSSFVNRFVLSQSFCTRNLAKKALPGLPSYEGIVVATSCGVVNPNPHRAEADVRMSAGILFALIRRLREQGQTLNALDDLYSYQGILG